MRTGRPRTDPKLLEARGSYKRNPHLRRAPPKPKCLAEHPIIMLRLNDDPLPDDASDADESVYFHTAAKDLREAWLVHARRITTRWAVRYPGTRPTCWWQFSAPRLSALFIIMHPEWGPWVLLEYCEPRLRIGGTGRTWPSDPSVVTGFPQKWEEENFDRDDPPRFESEAAYLKRHSLLLPGEASRLTRKDFERTETLPEAWWPNI